MHSKIYSIICAWNESDIIYATVKNLFAQGVDRVYLIDNDSSDDTVAQAVSAGAIHYHSFKTKYFNEEDKVRVLNGSVVAINREHDYQKVWWMYLDADEFPVVSYPYMSIRDMVNSFAPEIRCVNSRFIDHLPTHLPYYMSGFHPLEFQCVGVSSGNRKTQFFRYDKNRPHIISLGGFHKYNDQGQSLVAAPDALPVHHFNFRQESSAKQRLTALTRKQSDGTSRIDWMDNYEKRELNRPYSMYRMRLASLKKVYSPDSLDRLLTADTLMSLPESCRWYDLKSLYLAVKDFLDPLQYCIWSAYHSIARMDYNHAICSLNEAIHLAGGRLQMLLALRLAECFLCLGDRAMLPTVTACIKSNDPVIKRFAISILRKNS